MGSLTLEDRIALIIGRAIIRAEAMTVEVEKLRERLSAHASAPNGADVEYRVKQET